MNLSCLTWKASRNHFGSKLQVWPRYQCLTWLTDPGLLMSAHLLISAQAIRLSCRKPQQALRSHVPAIGYCGWTADLYEHPVLVSLCDRKPRTPVVDVLPGQWSGPSCQQSSLQPQPHTSGGCSECQPAHTQ
jgi:hypothetical protein